MGLWRNGLPHNQPEVSANPPACPGRREGNHHCLPFHKVELKQQEIGKS